MFLPSKAFAYSITAFADEHRMNADVRINECRLTECLFGTERTAEAFIGYQHDDPVSYALFFTDFSSFTGETGLYLEDLYVRPEARGSRKWRPNAPPPRQISSCSRAPTNSMVFLK